MSAAPFDPRPGGRLRGALMLLPVLLWAFGYMFWLLLASLLAPNHLRRQPTRVIRRWGAVILKMLGIQVEVHGREHLEGSGPRILLFNHISVFDLVVLSAIWDDRCSVIYKKEFHRIPMMGRLMRFFGMIPIDRGNRERAMQAMAEAARIVVAEDKRVLVAPEGTRSHDGRLGSFKRGPFHLALETRAPVVPLVMRGIEVLVPGLSRPPRSGRIRVDLLPPVATTDWTRAELDRHMEAVRQQFLDYLPDGLSAES